MSFVQIGHHHHQKAPGDAMKIINNGAVREALPPWWIGAIVRCDECGFAEEMEDGDSPKYDGI
jgi:hypothetical protein